MFQSCQGGLEWHDLPAESGHDMCEGHVWGKASGQAGANGPCGCGGLWLVVVV